VISKLAELGPSFPFRAQTEQLLRHHHQQSRTEPHGTDRKIKLFKSNITRQSIGNGVLLPLSTPWAIPSAMMT
jgi:hypothetical protein